MFSGTKFWIAGAGALALVVVATYMTVSSRPGPIPEKVRVVRVVAEQTGVNGYTVSANLPTGDCQPTDVTVEDSADGYTAYVMQPGPGQFNNLTCLIIGSVVLYTSDSDPVGHKVTVNGKTFTIAR
jgi:hypothetical protein